MLFMGIDVGTQGVRTVVVDETGRVVASKSIPFAVMNISDVPGYNEQSPEDWKNAFEASVSDCTAQLRKAGVDVSEIRAISVDATSGTMVALDANGEPLTAGIMYNDGRAKAEAAEVHSAMTAHEKKLGLKFGSSFSLPRVLWLTRNLPEISKKAKYFAHQADYITGLLCGEYGVSDYSNALKTGFDLIDGYWPEQIAGFGIDVNKLPQIVRPGSPIAHVSKTAAEKLGLSEKTMVVGGSTDGYASALAAGAVKPGNWASIIGTTFVLKGVTNDLIIDPNGSSYSHKLPDGDWLLGGAGNIGGKCLNFCADGRDFAELDKASEHLVPTGVRC